MTPEPQPTPTEKLDHETTIQSHRNAAIYTTLALTIAAMLLALWAVHQASDAKTSSLNQLSAQFVYCTQPGHSNLPYCSEPVAGSPGANGANGQNGAAGPAGSQGPPGPAGAQGPAGEAGKRGPRGFTGLDGATGKPGKTGPTGQSGDPGETGAKGDTGPQGPAGPRGDTGPAGAQGPAGPQGDPGTALPGSYACPTGQVLTGFTVAADGSVTLACTAPLLP